MKKRILALLTAAALCVGLIPASVLAAEETLPVALDGGENSGQEVTEELVNDLLEDDADPGGPAEEAIQPENQVTELEEDSRPEPVTSREEEAQVDDSGDLIAQSLNAKIYSGASYIQTLTSSATIRLTGVMPKDAVVKAYPVDLKMEDIRILAAYDITIYDAEGQEYQPQQGAIRVTIDTSEIREALAEDTVLTVYHMEGRNDTPTEVAVISAEEEQVAFSADRFSIYVVGDGTYTDTENNEGADIYTFRFHKYVWDESDLRDTVVSTQMVAADDTLNEPAAPEVEHHIFDGWFTTEQDGDTGEYEGFQYDFDRTVRENLDSWEGYAPLKEDGRYIVDLYSDYDQIYYVYFMSEEEPVIEREPDYVPHVIYTGEYSEKNDRLDTAYATAIYQDVYLETNFAVTAWYEKDGDEKVPVQDGFQVTDDLTLYPSVEDVIWIHFDMGGATNTEVTAIEPVHVLAGADSFGSVFPKDPVRAGYDFAGWYATEEYAGDPVTADSSPTALAAGGHILTLYAKWEETKTAYIVNFWRQKQTSSVEAKSVDFGDYTEEYDLVLTDYIQGTDENSLLTGSPVIDVMEVPDWGIWTGYAEAATEADDKYFGYEYAAVRTETELEQRQETIAGNGSTIINIYYDRETITWNFWNVEYDDRNTTDAKVVLTLTGLWGAELESGEWPSVDIAEKYDGSWIWCHYQRGRRIEYRYDTSYKYLPAGDKTKAVCNFYLMSIENGGTLYIYKEVLDPVNDGYEHTDSDGHTHDYEPFTSITLNAGVDYGISEKFDTHTAAGYINSIGSDAGEWQDISTNGGTSTPLIQVNADPDQEAMLFYDLNQYDVTLYSNGKTYSKATYKYSESLTPLPDREEMTKAVEKDETLCPAYYYEFAGWGSVDGSTVQVSIPDTMPGYDLTYYAIWKLKEVTITYHDGVEYGSVTGMPDNETIYATYTASEPEKPEREGYVFVGWRTDDGTYFDFSTVLYDDIDLTAIWFTDDTGHTLTYVVDINGENYAYTVTIPFIEGSEEVILDIEDVLASINEENDLNLTEDELAGLAARFLCWNTRANGNGIDYYPDSEYTFEKEDVVLYARWITEKEATLILDYNYPEGYMPDPDGNPAAEDGKDPLHPQTSVTKENLADIDLTEASKLKQTIIEADGKTYKFTGWATDQEAAEATILSDATVAVDNLNPDSGNILYAVWDALEVTVQIPVQKILEGRKWQAEDSFEFLLADDAGYTDTVVIMAEDDKTEFTKAFENITYTLEGTYRYTITEKIPDQRTDGITYDSDEVQVVVTVTVRDEELTATVDYGDESAAAATFTNIYNEIPEKKISEESAAGKDGAEVRVGDEIIYEITYYNNHNSEANITITDKLDAGVDYIGSDPAGECDDASHRVTWTIENVPAYERGSVKLTVKVNETALVTDQVTNTASVQVENDEAIETEPIVNPVEDFEDPTKDVDVGDGTEISVGDSLTYTITYKNPHSVEADVTITDVLDAGLDFVSASDGGVYDASTRTITWTIVSAGAYTKGSVSFTATVNSDALVKNEVDNTASVQVGDDPAVDTNKVVNPAIEPENPPEPEKPQDPTPDTGEEGSGTPSGSSKGAARTGDVNTIALWSILLIAGLACTAAAIRIKKRN